MNSMYLSFSTSHSLCIYIYSRGLVMRYTYMYSFKCGAIERNEVDLDWIYIDISFIHSLKLHMPWSITGPLLPPTSSSSSTTVGTYSIHSLKSIDSLIRYFGNGFLDGQCISSDHINRQTLGTVIFHNFYYSSCDVLNFLHIGCVSQESLNE